MHSFLLLLLAAIVNCGTFKLMRQVNRATNRAMALFDSEKLSPLYCNQSLSSLITNGPRHHLRVPSNAPPKEVNCIPGRSDFAAPARHDDTLAPAVCALIDAIDARDASDSDEPAVSLLRVKLCDSP